MPMPAAAPSDKPWLLRAAGMVAALGVPVGVEVEEELWGVCAAVSGRPLKTRRKTVTELVSPSSGDRSVDCSRTSTLYALTAPPPWLRRGLGRSGRRI
jgi:hypothetical protein